MKKLTLLAVVASISLALVTAGNAYTSQSEPSVKTPSELTLAQKNTKTPAKQKQKIKKFRRRVPNYYGQIGISKKQRATIYSIQKEYFDEITALEEKIEEVKEKRDGEIYDVLDDSQKKKLDNLREAATKKRKGRSSKKAKSKTT